MFKIIVIFCFVLDSAEDTRDQRKYFHYIYYSRWVDICFQFEMIIDTSAFLAPGTLRCCLWHYFFGSTSQTTLKNPRDEKVLISVTKITFLAPTQNSPNGDSVILCFYKLQQQIIIIILIPRGRIVSLRPMDLRFDKPKLKWTDKDFKCYRHQTLKGWLNIWLNWFKSLG